MNQIVKAANFKNYWNNNNERPKEPDQELKFEMLIDKFTFNFKIVKFFEINSGNDKYKYVISFISDSSGTEIKIDDLNFFTVLVGLLEQSDLNHL